MRRRMRRQSRAVRSTRSKLNRSKLAQSARPRLHLELRRSTGVHLQMLTARQVRAPHFPARATHRGHGLQSHSVPLSTAPEALLSKPCAIEQVSRATLRATVWSRKLPCVEPLRAQMGLQRRPPRPSLRASPELQAQAKRPVPHPSVEMKAAPQCVQHRAPTPPTRLLAQAA